MTVLKLYVYGYLNQVSSSRRLKRECACNLELIRLREIDAAIDRHRAELDRFDEVAAKTGMQPIHDLYS